MGAIHSLMDERRVRSLSSQRRQRQRREAELNALATAAAAATIGQKHATADQSEEREGVGGGDALQEVENKDGGDASGWMTSKRQLSYTASPPAYRKVLPSPGENFRLSSKIFLILHRYIQKPSFRTLRYLHTHI